MRVIRELVMLQRKYGLIHSGMSRAERRERILASLGYAVEIDGLRRAA